MQLKAASSWHLVLYRTGECGFIFKSTSRLYLCTELRFFFTWLNNVILFLLFVFGRSFAKRAPFMVGPDSRLTWIKLFNVRYKSTAAIPTRCKKLGRLWIGYVLWFVATHFKSFNNSSSDLTCYVFIIIWLWWPKNNYLCTSKYYGHVYNFFRRAIHYEKC